MSHPYLTYQNICGYIDEHDSAFDPSMNAGQQFERSSSILEKKKENNEPKENIFIVREGNYITKQMKVDTHAENESLSIIAHNQILVASAIFPAELATTICTNRIIF